MRLIPESQQIFVFSIYSHKREVFKKFFVFNKAQLTLLPLEGSKVEWLSFLCVVVSVCFKKKENNWLWIKIKQDR